MNKPWREVAIPHEDVLKGNFQESEFAADISQVHRGVAKPEYQDAQQFFARTFITEGMALLLDSVLKRLAHGGGDPVIQLQTAFGGGKTHTMLAVYHLVSSRYPARELNGIPTLLDKAEVLELPHAICAVIDGINCSVSEPKQHNDVTCFTLWGELAWQLAGAEGYALVKPADESATSPDKDSLITLLAKAAPCVILMDELVAYYRQFQEGKTYSAGSFETNMTFIQALTEAIKSVPNAMLLASLPDSTNAGEGRGQVVLRELEAYFRRLHKIWKPVSKDEAFSIVRRRLFTEIQDTQTVAQTCRAFSNFYNHNKTKLPSDTQENRYIERMQQAYPIHPEIFDRLYEDWSTLEGFQKTRGVLQLMAQIIFRLWQNGNTDLLIMPANLPLDDTAVKNKCLDFLPQGWESVIDQDIDGEHSRPAELDRQPIFGKIQAGRRLTRTLFLGSAPASTGHLSKGLALEHILLGVAQPEQSLGHYEDALKQLLDKLNYINHEDRRYWFDITPNLRREMETRKQRFKEKDHVIPLIQTEIKQLISNKHFFAGVHIFSDSADIPDDYGTGPRLVILPFTSAYSKGVANTAFSKAREILQKRGEQPRQKQNRLLFLAADNDAINRLRDLAKTYLAWSSIVEDSNNENLVLDTIQVKQAKKQKEDASRALLQMLRSTYKWLIVPSAKAEDATTIIWEAVSITASTNMMLDIENKLKEEEWVITHWSPVHLLNELKRWYFKADKHEVNALKVWQDSCCYLFLPRLLNSHVFEQAISDGLKSKDYFAYASAKENDKYLGFVFGSSGLIQLNDQTVLIEKETATAYLESIAPSAPPPTTFTTIEQQPEIKSIEVREPTPAITKTQQAFSKPVKTQFHASIELNPTRAKMDFAVIVDEVIQHFATQSNVTVKISIDIEARISSEQGFTDNVQRTIRENCNALKFTHSEFED